MISLFCHCPIFKWRLFQSFHLSIRTEGASPVMGLCQAVIVSVPFWPRHRSALCMWKEAERRGEHWIDTQTSFCSLTLYIPLPRDWGADTGTINEEGGSGLPNTFFLIWQVKLSTASQVGLLCFITIYPPKWPLERPLPYTETGVLDAIKPWTFS